jgi:hypothetical protein
MKSKAWLSVPLKTKTECGFKRALLGSLEDLIKPSLKLYSTGKEIELATVNDVLDHSVRRLLKSEDPQDQEVALPTYWDDLAWHSSSARSALARPCVERQQHDVTGDTSNTSLVRPVMR